MGGRCGIVRIEDSTPVIQINETIPALGEEEVIMWGNEVVCVPGQGEYVSQGLTALDQIVKSAMERPVQREAIRGNFGGSWPDLV
jgi:hypothetical protein